MTKISRASLVISAIVLSVGIATACVAFAQDKMGKDGMTNTMSKDGMKKDDAMAPKDGMKKSDAMSKDTMKKDDAMSKDNMKK